MADGENFGFEAFRQIIEAVYQQPLNYKLFSKNTPDHYVDFDLFLREPGRGKWSHPVEHRKLKAWRQRELSPLEAQNVWLKTVQLLNVLDKYGNSALESRRNALKNALGRASDFLAILRASKGDPFTDGTDSEDGVIRPFDSDVIEAIPICVKITVGSMLSELRFHHVPSNSSLTILEPRLLLESLSGGNEKFRIVLGPVKPSRNYFEEAESSESIRRDLGRHSLIDYASVRLHWLDCLCTWPPSIDALYTAMVLRNSAKQILKQIGPIRRVCDIGCGTGFLGSVAASLFPEAEDVCFSDVERGAVRLALYNYELNFPDKKHPCGFIGSGVSPLLGEGKYDLAIGTPPYIAAPRHDRPLSHSTTSTGLLEDIIRNYGDVARSLILCVSNAAEAELLRAVKILRNRPGSVVKHSMIDKRWVPFRVKTLSKEKLEQLSLEGTIADLHRSLPKDFPQSVVLDNRGFRFWHELQVHFFRT